MKKFLFVLLVTIVSASNAFGADLESLSQLKGGHHFGGDYKSIAEIILKEAG
jgi:hypothetical protein